MLNVRQARRGNRALAMKRLLVRKRNSSTRPFFAMWKEHTRHLIMQEALCLENEAKLLAMQIEWQNKCVLEAQASVVRNLFSVLKAHYTRAKAR